LQEISGSEINKKGAKAPFLFLKILSSVRPELVEGLPQFAKPVKLASKV